MTFDVLGPGALDYLPCRYGTSRLLFRGPRRKLTAPYLAFVGSTETYGKFIADPFPALLEKELGMTCVNFGQMNAGIDAFVQDAFVLKAASEAKVTVVQILSAQNMTNRFYTVHPRRNDRFIEPSVMLRTIFREVDFSEFNFNKHMIQHLLHTSPERFVAVKKELQQAWVARMRLMLKQIEGKVVLLWFAAHSPDGQEPGTVDGPWSDPMFVTRAMIDEVRQYATEFIEVCASAPAVAAGTRGMVYSELEYLAAAEMLGPQAHQEAAEQLADTLKHLIT